MAAAAVVVATMSAVPAVGQEQPGAPGQVELSGVLRVVPAEAAPVHIEQGEPAPEVHLHHEGSVALLTDGGSIVELTDVDAEGLRSGQRFTATVDVPADVRDAVEADGSDAATGDDVAAAAEAVDAALPVVRSVAEPVVAPAAAALPHTVDVMFYNFAGSGASTPPGGTIDAAIARMSEYWASESAGQITQITRPSAIKFQTVSSSVACDEFSAWTAAAAAFSTPEQTYWAGSSRRHLLVIVPDACGGGGLGTIGNTIHTGGLIHAQVPVASPADWDQVMFHEFGHNLTLNHSNLRECDAPVVDSPRNGTTGLPSDSRCDDLEYWDLYDVMGLGYYITGSGGEIIGGTTRNISTLNATHKAQIGALTTTNGMTAVTTSGGLVQTHVLQASSAASGARALRVTDTNGEQVYVEYRAGTGRDANAMYTQWQSLMGDNEYMPGVRVMRLYPDLASGAFGGSIALSRHTGTTPPRVMWLGAGNQLKTHTNNVTVRVVSTTASTATVEIGFYTPYTTAPTGSTISVNGGGDAYVGKTLTVNGVGTSAWAPAPSSVSYQWLRNGAAITEATKATYQLQGADKGQEITVRATPVKAGYRNISVLAPVLDPVPGGPSATGGGLTDRISGSSRYDTAVKVSERAFPGASDAAEIAYIATGLNYPDALGAAPSAAFLGGPLLLVPSTGALPDSVATELQRLSPARVVIVGGQGAVPDAMEAQVVAAATVDGLPPETERLRGSSRYETARALVDDAFADGSVSQVYIATGRNYPDALSASAVAGGKGAPVVLVDGTMPTLDADTVALLAQLKASSGMKAWVIGGTGAVSTGIQNQLQTLGYTPERLSGANRYDTSAKINDQITGPVLNLYLATGTGFADALAGAVLAGVQAAPLHVTPPNCVSAGAGAQIGAKAVGSVTLIGGTGALNANAAALGMCP